MSISDRQRLLLHAFLVIAAACAVYLNALPNGFAYDDVPMVQRNPILESDQPWWRPWVEPYWAGSNVGDVIDVLYRPLTVQTYGLQRRLLGQDPLSFHLLNIVLHAAVSLAVWRMARLLRTGDAAALLAALVFAVHPIHVEAVANVVGRAEVLSALGTFGAVLCEERRLRLEQAGQSRSSRYLLATGLMLLSVAAAVFSKETGAAAVVIVAAWRLRSEWLDRPVGAGRQARPSRRVAALRATALRTMLPALAILGAYLWIRYEVCAERLVVGGQRAGPGNFLREADAAARLWSVWSVLGRYVGLMLYPARLLCDYSVNVVTPVRTPFEPYALVGLATVAGLLAAALRSLRAEGFAAFVALGFAATYAVPGNVLVYIDVIMAERLFYGPSAWLCLAGGLALRRAPRSTAFATVNVRGALAPAAAAALLALSIRTWVRNPVWSDTRTLLETDLARMSPGQRSSHLCGALAKTCAAQGDLRRAEALAREAIGIYADAPGVHAVLADVCERQHRFVEAATCWQNAVTLAPSNLEFVARLKAARQRAGGIDPHQELEAARAQLAAQPDDPAARRRWAKANESLDPAAAAEAYARLLADDASDVEALKALAYVSMVLQRKGEAIQAYRRALDLAPEDWEAHTNLAVLLIDRTDRPNFDPQAAILHARRAVELNPTHWDLRVNLAEVLAHCGREAQAAELFDALADQSEPGSTQQRMYRDRAAALRD